jgi:hypothetical protein
MKWLTIANFTQGVSFPISITDLETIVKECHEDYDGTGEPTGSRCRPNTQQILDICQHGAPLSKGDQPRPEAYTLMAHAIFGLERGSKVWTPLGEKEWNGVDCFQAGDNWGVYKWPIGICEFRDKIVPQNWAIPLDVWTVLGFSVLCCFTYVLRCCLNGVIRSTKRQDQREENKKIYKAREENYERSSPPRGSGPPPGGPSRDVPLRR